MEKRRSIDIPQADVKSAAMQDAGALKILYHFPAPRSQKKRSIFDFEEYYKEKVPKTLPREIWAVKTRPERSMHGRRTVEPSVGIANSDWALSKQSSKTAAQPWSRGMFFKTRLGNPFRIHPFTVEISTSARICLSCDWQPLKTALN